MNLGQSHHTWALQQTYGQTSSENLPVPFLAWPLPGILVFHLLYGTALLNFGLFSVEHSTLQRWFGQIGQEFSSPVVYKLGLWAFRVSSSTFVKGRSCPSLSSLPACQVDLLDPLDQEVPGVHKHIWVPSLFFSLGQRSLWRRKNHPHPHHHWGQGHHHLPLLSDYHFFWGDLFLHLEIFYPY